MLEYSISLSSTEQRDRSRGMVDGLFLSAVLILSFNNFLRCGSRRSAAAICSWGTKRMYEETGGIAFSARKAVEGFHELSSLADGDLGR